MFIKEIAVTNLLYLENSYLFEAEAEFVDLSETEKGMAIVLDRTIFYPQGGGQPADSGKIFSGNNLFKVTDVRLDETGTVYHFGEFLSGNFEAGERVHLKIDSEKRRLHVRLHSAGHLLDCAVYKLNLLELKPIKGFHFAVGAHVEYEGIRENLKEMIPELQKTLDELIEQDLVLEKLVLSTEKAANKGLFAPVGKSVRVVSFAGYPTCGCGGTHVKSSKEIGKITIRKVKTRQGKTKISYAIASKG